MKIRQGTVRSWSAWLSFSSIGLAVLVLVLGYGFSGRWLAAPFAVGVGALWALLQARGWAPASTAGLALTVLAAAAGFWLRVQAGWLLVGMIAGLSAWDMDRFEQHLRRAGQVQGRLEMERRHLLRLALVDALGLLLGIVALQIQVRISFLAALLLAALLTLGAGELILYLRKGHKG